MICPLAIAHTDDENWVHHDARIAELEAEVERLRAVCDSQNRLIEISAAEPKERWTPTGEERKILDFAVSRIPEDRRDQKRRPLRNGLPNVNDAGGDSDI